MFDGNLAEGEIQIGQVVGALKEIKPAGEIVQEIVEQYKQTMKRLKAIKTDHFD
jgi:enoyl-[acyl-carrier protein] reductase II